MKITLLCSCGLLLEYAQSRILIDAPNACFAPFVTMSDDALQSLKREHLDGIFFTHLHPDHFDQNRVAQLLSAKSDAVTFYPAYSTPEKDVFRAGEFVIETVRFAHTPAPQYPELPHYVMLVTAGEKCLYITADAAPDAQMHRAILEGRKPNAAFWNSQCLSYPELRRLLHDSVERNYIYHMPIDPEDVSGIQRKCVRNLERFDMEVPNMRVLTKYPSVIYL